MRYWTGERASNPRSARQGVVRGWFGPLGLSCIILHGTEIAPSGSVQSGFLPGPQGLGMGIPLLGTPLIGDAAGGAYSRI